MNRKRLWLILLAAVWLAGAAHAQTGSGYDLTWNTIDGGGGATSIGSYTLIGTAGQPDASAATGGGAYTLAGGFWSGAAVNYPSYLPLVLKE